ncbi:MAG: HAD-IC family P-type ATPase [Pseudomonadota bacterium]
MQNALLEEQPDPAQEHDAAAPWHAQSGEQVLAALDGSPEGLSAREAARRLAHFGPNCLTPEQPPSPWRRFLHQFHNVLIYVLLAAAVVTAGLGQWIDSAVIAAVVIVNAIIGFVQEGRAESALDAIRALLSQSALVVRDGRAMTLPAEQLVPGDIVTIQSGDKVPADLRFLSAKSLQCQEAILTGESLPVDKGPGAADRSAALGARGCMAFSGTLVTHGQGSGVVVATGDQSEIGRVGTLLSKVERLDTPLLRQMAAFGRWLTAAILLLAAGTFAVGTMVYGFTAPEMFLAAVGLAVAAIPEGLPAILTVTLAIGVERMARRNAIIRRLPAVETLGAVSVICTDKTGTLTRNEMTVRSLAVGGLLYEVTGSGYRPQGDILLDGRPQAASAELRALVLGGLLCNDASLHESEGEWLADGDPTEAALLTLARKVVLDPIAVRGSWQRSDEIPFESEQRYMATLHHDQEGLGRIYVKGAPERILEMCGSTDNVWPARLEEMAGRGERVLALAAKDAPASKRSLCEADMEDGFAVLGLFGLADPPREEAVQAIAECKAAGIGVKMITGDHGATAQAIAGQLGLANCASVLTGADLDAMTSEELSLRAREVDVFARTSPEHKLRLVQALQGRGQMVAMTGDGVNDAPALKQADVGIAMGRKGSEAAKEAGVMVLADDNFASIAHAVEEGRRVYDNLKKAILFILPTNGGEAFTVVAAVAFGQVLPITAVQILWINMITTVTLALALAFEPVETAVMQRPPRRAGAALLSGFLLWRVVFVSLVLVLGVFGVFLWSRHTGTDLATARTAAVNTLVLFEVFYLFNVRKLESSPLEGLFSRSARVAWLAVATVLVFQVLFTHAPFMQWLFQSRPLSAESWALCTAIAASIFLLVEAEKLITRRLLHGD